MLNSNLELVSSEFDKQKRHIAGNNDTARINVYIKSTGGTISFLLTNFWNASIFSCDVNDIKSSNSASKVFKNELGSTDNAHGMRVEGCWLNQSYSDGVGIRFQIVFDSGTVNVSDIQVMNPANSIYKIE